MYVVLVYDVSQQENGAKRWSKIFKICKRYKKLRIINDQWDKDSFVSKTCRTIQKCSKQLFRKNVNTIKGDSFMNTYIIYFVSVINCYVSAQLIFDHFKINFNSIYSKKWIYNIVTISVGVLIGIINLFNYPILNFASWIIILTPVICLLFYDPWNSKKTLLLDLYFFIFLLTFLKQ